MRIMIDTKCCIRDKLARIESALADTASRIKGSASGSTTNLEMISLRNDLLILKREALENLPNARDAELSARNEKAVAAFAEEAFQHHRNFIDKLASDGDAREVKRWVRQSLDVRRTAMMQLHLAGL